MAKTFVVYAENLTQRVKIAFTLTPRTSHSIDSIDYDPIAFKVMRFRTNDTQPQNFSWHPEIGVSLWSTKEQQGRRINTETSCCRIPPTYYVELTCSKAHLSPQWSRSRPSNHLRAENMVAARNRTGKDQLMALGFTTEWPVHFFYPMACYNIASENTLYAPSSIALQAYVVADIKDRRNQRLMPKDLGSPIFNEPLECDGLPMESIWKLSETPRGQFTLEQQERTLPNLQEAAARIDQLTQYLANTTAFAQRVDQRVGAAEEQIRVIEESHFMVYRAAQTRPAISDSQSADTSSAASCGPPPIIQFRSSAAPSQGFGPPALYNASGAKSGTNLLLSSHQSGLHWQSAQNEA